MLEIQYNLGYACINTILRKEGIFTNRSLRLDTLKEKGYEYLYSLIDQNLEDLMTILKWNVANKIYFFRVSSAMFPFITHPEYGYKLDKWKSKLKEIGAYAKKHKIRLTMHQQHFDIINSLNEDVLINTFADLNMFCDILNYMGLDKNSVIIIHGGGKKPNKEEALNRIKTNFKKLRKDTQKRIVLENDEICFTVNDLLPLCNELKIPLVLDFHHDNLNPSDYIIEDVLKTWSIRGIKPKFHLSESRPSLNNINRTITDLRGHSDIIEFIPKRVPIDVDLMLEAKLKEQAIIHLKNKCKDKICYIK